MAMVLMDHSLLREIDDHAVKIAREAGHILLEQFRKPLDIQFKSKNNRDPVTVADRLSDEHLKRSIKEKFPAHGILSEEGEAPRESDSPFVWVLDPLDGTCNFMNGLPFFAVSVGVMWNRQPIMGSIYASVSHRATEGVYHACAGQGAFLDDERIQISRQPSPRPLTDMPVYPGSRFRLAGRSRKEPHETRNMGSMTLELTMAASGIFQYAIFGRPRIWDIAAGVVLVKEAGGLALIRPSRARKWVALERFQLEQENGAESLEKLKNWSFPLFVGQPDANDKVIKDIQIRRRPLSTLIKQLWSRRK